MFVWGPKIRTDAIKGTSRQESAASEVHSEHSISKQNVAEDSAVAYANVYVGRYEVAAMFARICWAYRLLQLSAFMLKSIKKHINAQENGSLNMSTMFQRGFPALLHIWRISTRFKRSWYTHICTSAGRLSTATAPNRHRNSTRLCSCACNCWDRAHDQDLRPVSHRVTTATAQPRHGAFPGAAAHLRPQITDIQSRAAS